MPISNKDKELEVVYATSNYGKIIIAKSLLESAGITYFTKGEHTSNFFGWGGPGSFYPPSSQVEILVPKEEAENCREVLKDLDVKP